LHAAPAWLPLAASVAAAVAIWWGIYEPNKRKLSLWSLLVLLALAFAVIALATR